MQTEVHQAGGHYTGCSSRMRGYLPVMFFAVTGALFERRDGAAEICQQFLILRIVAQQFMAGIDQLVHLFFAQGKAGRDSIEELLPLGLFNIDEAEF